MDGRSFAVGFIQVQALGNWGEGEIVPSPAPPQQQQQQQLEVADLAATAEPDLDDFFDSVVAAEEGAEE
jgi:hypothetical protein